MSETGEIPQPANWRSLNQLAEADFSRVYNEMNTLAVANSTSGIHGWSEQGLKRLVDSMVGLFGKYSDPNPEQQQTIVQRSVGTALNLVTIIRNNSPVIALDDLEHKITSDLSDYRYDLFEKQAELKDSYHATVALVNEFLAIDDSYRELAWLVTMATLSLCETKSELDASNQEFDRIARETKNAQG